MEGILKKVSLTFSNVFPVVKADDSEEDVVDPQVVLRDECGKSHCTSWLEKLETCTARVKSKKKTTESCNEEMVDFVTCVDHCVAKTLFSKLK